MKHLKKIVSLLLTAVMVLAMCIPVMANNAATATTCAIKAPATNHVYKIYQIFTGDLREGVLSNIKWGANGNGTQGDMVDETTLNALAAVNGKSDRKILDVVETYADLTKAQVSSVTQGQTYNAVPGYYLIKDDEDVEGIDSYTTYIVKVVGNVTIKPKSDVPDFVKKIKDTNDTTGVTSNWQDSADYDIGDKVPFKLEGTVASNYDDYKTYYFAFHDIEEKGLTFDPTSVKVFVENANGTTEITTDTSLYTVNYTENAKLADGCTFEVVFNNLKDITSVTAGSKIRVEYTSLLNESAVLGNEGNVNKAKLEFSNNPNSDQTGKPDKPGETPWDNVIVFTYQVVVNKYANSVSDANKLTGAEFTLSKKLKDNTTKDIAVVKSTDGTTFTFKGLDDGDYILTETVTPDKYNTIDPIKFTVAADHKIVWETEDRTDILTELNGNATSGKITFTATKNDGKLETNVINKSGSSLPETGGIGTTIFYVVGVILMLGAGVLLVTKKRMSSNR